MLQLFKVKFFKWSNHWKFSVQDQDLALYKSWSLPVPLTILEERSVGPGLGKDSIEAGKFASIIAIVVVMIFMLIYYGIYGLFAMFH